MKYFYLSYRIPFSETDAMGIVHHSNHARYFERGRVELLRQIDLSYTGIMQRGMHFPLTDMSVKFRKPLRFDDVLWIETSVSQLTKIRLHFSYRIIRGDSLRDSFATEAALESETLVRGLTEHCCVNNEGRPREMDEEILSVLERYLVKA